MKNQHHGTKVLRIRCHGRVVIVYECSFAILCPVCRCNRQMEAFIHILSQLACRRSPHHHLFSFGRPLAALLLKENWPLQLWPCILTHIPRKSGQLGSPGKGFNWPFALICVKNPPLGEMQYRRFCTK